MDFGVSYNSPVPGGGVLLAEKVQIILEIEAALLPPPHAGDRVWLARRARSSAREILGALRGQLAAQQAGGLADLDEVSVRVPHVAPDLRSAVDRRRDELRPFAFHSS